MNQINEPVIFGKSDSAQKPGLPKLILPAFRGAPTRKERLERRNCLFYPSPSPRDMQKPRMPASA